MMTNRESWKALVRSFRGGWEVRHRWGSRTVHDKDDPRLTYRCQCRWWLRLAFLLTGR